MPSRKWSVLVGPVLATALTLVACSSPSTQPVAPVYVDPASGLDTNPGTQAAPFKTIAKALQAPASNGVIMLEPGTYDVASGESWPLSLPNGIELRGDGTGAVLVGSPTTNGLAVDAVVSLTDITLKGFQIAVVVSAGSLTVTGVTFDNDGEGMVLEGTSQALLTNTDFSGGGAGVAAQTASTFTMTGGTVSGLSGVAFYADGTSSLQLDQVQVTNTTAEVVQARTASTALLTNCSIDSSSPQGSTTGDSLSVAESSTLTLLNTTISGAAGYAVHSFGSSTTTITGGSIAGSGNAAIDAEASLTVDGTSILGNDTGIYATGDATIRNAVIKNNTQAGIAYLGTSTLKVRGSRIENNLVGVDLEGTGGGGLADLGGTTDPGANTIQAPSGGTGLYAPNWTVSLVIAYGNTWVPSAQGADAGGGYPDGTVSGPTSGQNYTLGSGVGLFL